MRFAPSLRRWSAVVVFVCAVLGARAHDPLEISADGRLRADRLELKLTMARSTAALATATNEEEKSRFEPADFEKVRARLAAGAREFYLVRHGDRPLELRGVDVALTVENDVEFALTFAAPSPGPLDFFARLFARLPAEGYGSTIIVIGPKGEQLGFKFINGDDPAVRIVVPPSAGETKAAPAAVKS